RTTKVAGVPGTVVPTARRRALAITTTLSGTVSGRSMRTFTNAIPAALVTPVAVAASVRAVSVVTRVTGPAVGGCARVYTIGRRAGVVLLQAVRGDDLERDRAAQVTRAELAAGQSRHEHQDADPALRLVPTGQGASAAAAGVGPEAPRSRSAWVACSIHFCASG